MNNVNSRSTYIHRGIEIYTQIKLLGNFIELYSSVKTLLALWSCSPGSNPIIRYATCGKSILVFAIHEKYTNMYGVKREESLGLYDLESYSAITLILLVLKSK